MIIGYNPGGCEKDFDENNIKVPNIHDYFAHIETNSDYKLAKQMKKIFCYADSIKELETSVKLNLIFFRSKQSKDLTNQELINFSKQKVKEIISELHPQLIITEGFTTFNELLFLFKEQELNEEVIENKERRIIKVGLINQKIKTIGLIHPSGARGISDVILKRLGEFINRKIEN
jgi:hypothetical protein